MPRAAYTLVELLLSLGLIATVTAVGSPGLLGARDAVLADGAADYLASRLHGARMEALKRRAYVAIRFESDADGITVSAYADGNANGVRSTDITSGADTRLAPPERLEQRFAGVRFGFETGVPDVDGAAVAPTADPIRVGTSRMLSFSPTGTSSTGTVYLRGRGRRQLAVRVLGATGRVRTLWFDFGGWQWQSR
jgi:type II secretory pathway pseudopilin PulG